jgi:hypothetical protein
MIISEKVNIKINPSNLKNLKKFGYDNLKIGETIEIDIKHLSKSSHCIIEAKCDICDKIKKLSYKEYNRNFNNYNIFTCGIKCSQVKVKLTNNKIFGTDYASQSDNIKEKTKNTINEKYGTDNVMHLDLFKNKVKQTNKIKYGTESYLSQSKSKEKLKQYNLKNHGVEYLLSSKKIQDKIKKTINTKEYKDKIIQRNNIKTLKKYYNIVKKYNNFLHVLEYYDRTFTILDGRYGEIFKINFGLLYDRIYAASEISTILNPICSQKSGKEIQIVNFTQDLHFNVLENKRNILQNKELDIYIPEYNLAIEFNGLYWHSEKYKDKNYHLEKSLKCLEKGIDLLHIWEDEWVFKQDIVKSIITNKLKKSEETIYARKCMVKNIEDKELIENFLNNNHIEGYIESDINIGILHKDVLVGLMTFKKYKNNTFEILRFCIKTNTNVIGAASKLFTYFKRTHRYKTIITYTDFRLFNGKVFEKLGFTNTNLSKPNYYLCKGMNRYHKSLIIKEEHKKDYFKIHDCGKTKWIYKNI